jgi:hypothetical protein
MIQALSAQGLDTFTLPVGQLAAGSPRGRSGQPGCGLVPAASESLRAGQEWSRPTAASFRNMPLADTRARAEPKANTPPSAPTSQ